MTAPADSASTPAFLAATARHPLWRLGTWIPVCAKWALELQISHICACSDATLDLDLPLFGTCVGADGDLDLIVGNGWGCSNLYTCCSGGPTSNEANELLINNGTGGFSKSDTFPAGNAQTHAVAFADVDGDLDLDLLIGNFNGANEILLIQAFARGQALGGAVWHLMVATRGTKKSSRSRISLFWGPF